MTRMHADRHIRPKDRFCTGQIYLNGRVWDSDCLKRTARVCSARDLRIPYRQPQRAPTPKQPYGWPTEWYVNAPSTQSPMSAHATARPGQFASRVSCGGKCTVSALGRGGREKMSGWRTTSISRSVSAQ
jgi:hypothetical protein